jgi:hypothetical protein
MHSIDLVDDDYALTILYAVDVLCGVTNGDASVYG